MWDRRAPVAFGMPSPAFNVKDALMMIHDDNEIFSRTQYLNYYQASLQNKDYNPAEDFPQFSKTKANRVNRVLKSIFEDLEKFEINDKGWQKESNMLSPDFDTQVVAGDIMHTNTYMTTRLPGSREP